MTEEKIEILRCLSFPQETKKTRGAICDDLNYTWQKAINLLNSLIKSKHVYFEYYYYGITQKGKDAIKKWDSDGTQEELF